MLVHQAKYLSFARTIILMPAKSRQTLGVILKKLREDSLLSLRSVEKLTGISNAYLSQLENDRAQNPSASLLSKLAELYKIEFNYLLSLAGIVESEAVQKKSFGEYIFQKENLTENEEEELIQYLKFMRLRDKKKL
jgi:HTH-type transcriptional regulator, competence development regulator